MNWLSRFSEMVNELKQHPQVALLNFNTFPPVEDSQFDFLEKKYNTTFPKTIFEFYRKTNGLQLRWIFKNNEHYSLEKETSIDEILAWDFFQKRFRWEDGGMMILPLEMALEQNVLDAFSEDYNMIFTKEDFRLTVSEDDEFSNDFFTTDLESYLEFLMAGKGLISRRSFFYKKPVDFLDKNSTSILTPLAFWTTQKTLHLDQALLKDKFPLCDQVRFSESQINRTNLQLLAKNGTTISQEELAAIIEKHHEFLMAGGVGGEWKVLEIRGIVTAFYHHPKDMLEGEQAVLERKNLAKTSFQNIELPYSNFCATFAEAADFSNSNFENSLFADAFLEAADFYNSTLTNADFSRSDLRNANFKNANLSGVDFENCDLRGANFENAKMEGASFVGSLMTT